jgi:hypothetical protein
MSASAQVAAMRRRVQPLQRALSTAPVEDAFIAILPLLEPSVGAENLWGYSAHRLMGAALI